MIALLFAAVLGASDVPHAPGHAASSVTTVDLAKAPLWRDRERWVGKTVAEVLPPSTLARLVLIRAETSATADIDAANLRRLLSQASRFKRAPADLSASSVIWEALLETTDGRFFLLRVYQQWALLISSEGHGYFVRR